LFSGIRPGRHNQKTLFPGCVTEPAIQADEVSAGLLPRPSEGSGQLQGIGGSQGVAQEKPPGYVPPRLARQDLRPSFGQHVQETDGLVLLRCGQDCPMGYLRQAGRRRQRDVRRFYAAIHDLEGVAHVELPEKEGELCLQLRA
jgi:hypothetical protein